MCCLCWRRTVVGIITREWCKALFTDWENSGRLNHVTGAGCHPDMPGRGERTMLEEGSGSCRSSVR
jgi:hypothetical protein